jgi:6-phosphogluconolactonase
VINEMQNTVNAMEYDAEKGALKVVQTITTLPKDFKGTSYTAEVQVHPSGKFLYGSNRGNDSIAIFSIDPKTGELTAVGHQASQIKTPRNFGIDPTGAYLLVANQGSGSIVVFRIDQKTGELKMVDAPVEVPAPVCVKFLPKP